MPNVPGGGGAVCQDQRRLGDLARQRLSQCSFIKYFICNQWIFFFFFLSLCLSDVLSQNTSARLHVFQGSYLGNEVSRVKSLVKTRGLIGTSGKTESHSFMSCVGEVGSKWLLHSKKGNAQNK